MGIEDSKYVSTATYRKSGQAVSSPTWIVGLDGGKVGFWTSSQSGKVRRLRANPRISLQASDARGRTKPGAAQLEGTAELVTSGPEFEQIQARIRAKHGFVVRLTHFMNTVGHRGKWPYGDVGVVVTPAASDRSDTPGP
jgi:PPOX class probable F420-dependent enzyme